MTIKRHLDTQLLDHIAQRRLGIVLLGPRQVGKTTLLKRLFPDADHFLLDNEAEKTIFENYDINFYKMSIANLGHKILVLDEIQNLSNPGRAMKILYDQIPEIQLIATGSSALNIKNRTSESMAGRKLDYYLFPLTFSEMLLQKGLAEELDYKIISNPTEVPLKKRVHRFDLSAVAKEILTYGLYPYLVENPHDTAYLTNIAQDILYKDILELNLIENRSDAKQLLKLLAYQIGNLVNYSQIANRLSMDIRTVQRYINIFEEAFILFRLYPFSKNPKVELSKSPKIYFYDVGIRNAIIDNFDSLDIRADRGALFENFIISEIYKINHYSNSNYTLHYWRTKAGSEVDLVLHKRNELVACEIKLSGGVVSAAFRNRYPEAKQNVITLENFY